MNQLFEAGRRYILNRVNGRPLYVSVEVTQTCNADCGFCEYRRSNETRERITQGAKSFRGRLEELKPVMVGFVGGEPLLRNDLEKLVAEAKETGVPYVQVTTNGSALSSRRYQSLSDSGLDRLNISLDYLDERHDAERGISGLSRKITSFIDGLDKASGAVVAINTILMMENREHVPDILEYARLNSLSVNIIPYNSIRSGGKEHQIISGSDDELYLLKKRFSEVIANPWASLQGFDTFLKTGKYGTCDAGRSFLWMLPDGTLKACVDHPDSKGDDLKKIRAFKKTNTCNSCYAACRSIPEIASSFNPFSLISLAKDLALTPKRQSF